MRPTIKELPGIAMRPAWLVTLAIVGHAPVHAQTADDPVAREVVQQLPSPEVQRLNTALRRLARNPRNLSALVEAGNASLQVGDLDAAMGFFGRAQSLDPSNADAKLGRAAVFLRSERPIEALRIYAEADRSGISTRHVAADRGLAFDLAGNNTQAQTNYRSVLQGGANPEISRRLAISQAISGDEAGFEATLLPMLERGDLAAFRARAFGLAILGKLDEATKISDAVMPRDLASRIAPYLAFMPRLTKAQQAAAANLGIFPQAAQIGRDDQQIAQYAETGTISPVANVDSRLVPAGRQLGTQASSSQSGASTGSAPPPRSARGRPDRTGSRLAAVARNQTGDAARSVEENRPSPRVEDAFAEMESPVSSAEVSGGNRVDITSIEPPREAPPQAEPAQPAHPSRHWVQVATGRDRSALRFDWRRIVRRAPTLLGEFEPHVVRWGQANRLLAGPLDSASDARALVNTLKAEGVDSFPYTSPEGQEITELQ